MLKLITVALCLIGVAGCCSHSHLTKDAGDPPNRIIPADAVITVVEPEHNFYGAMCFIDNDAPVWGIARGYFHYHKDTNTIEWTELTFEQHQEQTKLDAASRCVVLH